MRTHNPGSTGGEAVQRSGVTAVVMFRPRQGLDEAGSTAMEAACAFDHGNVADGSLCMAEILGKKAH